MRRRGKGERRESGAAANGVKMCTPDKKKKKGDERDKNESRPWHRKNRTIATCRSRGKGGGASQQREREKEGGLYCIVGSKLGGGLDFRRKGVRGNGPSWKKSNEKKNGRED